MISLYEFVLLKVLLSLASDRGSVMREIRAEVAALGMSTSWSNTILNRMAAKGLVSRREHRPTRKDGRRSNRPERLFKVTKKGRTQHQQMLKFLRLVTGGE